MPVAEHARIPQDGAVQQGHIDFRIDRTPVLKYPDKMRAILLALLATLPTPLWGQASGAFLRVRRDAERCQALALWIADVTSIAGNAVGNNVERLVVAAAPAFRDPTFSSRIGASYDALSGGDQRQLLASIEKCSGVPDWVLSQLSRAFYDPATSLVAKRWREELSKAVQTAPVATAGTTSSNAVAPAPQPAASSGAILSFDRVTEMAKAIDSRQGTRLPGSAESRVVLESGNLLMASTGDGWCSRWQGDQWGAQVSLVWQVNPSTVFEADAAFRELFDKSLYPAIAARCRRTGRVSFSHFIRGVPDTIVAGIIATKGMRDPITGATDTLWRFYTGQLRSLAALRDRMSPEALDLLKRNGSARDERGVGTGVTGAGGVADSIRRANAPAITGKLVATEGVLSMYAYAEKARGTTRMEDRFTLVSETSRSTVTTPAARALVRRVVLADTNSSMKRLTIVVGRDTVRKLFTSREQAWVFNDPVYDNPNVRNPSGIGLRTYGLDYGNLLARIYYGLFDEVAPDRRGTVKSLHNTFFYEFGQWHHDFLPADTVAYTSRLVEEWVNGWGTTVRYDEYKYRFVAARRYMDKIIEYQSGDLGGTLSRYVRADVTQLMQRHNGESMALHQLGENFYRFANGLQPLTAAETRTVDMPRLADVPLVHVKTQRLSQFLIELQSISASERYDTHYLEQLPASLTNALVVSACYRRGERYFPYCRAYWRDSIPAAWQTARLLLQADHPLFDKVTRPVSSPAAGLSEFSREFARPYRPGAVAVATGAAQRTATATVTYPRGVHGLFAPMPGSPPVSDFDGVIKYGIVPNDFVPVPKPSRASDIVIEMEKSSDGALIGVRVTPMDQMAMLVAAESPVSVSGSASPTDGQYDGLINTPAGATQGYNAHVVLWCKYQTQALQLQVYRQFWYRQRPAIGDAERLRTGGSNLARVGPARASCPATFAEADTIFRGVR